MEQRGEMWNYPLVRFSNAEKTGVEKAHILDLYSNINPYYWKFVQFYSHIKWGKRWKTGVRFPAGSRLFSIRQHVQNCAGPHPASSTLDRGEWPASRTGRFTPRERTPGTHWIAGGVGPRVGLDAVTKRKKSFPLPGLEPTVMHFVAQRYATELSRLLVVTHVWI
jgi:hypothetical protein